MSSRSLSVVLYHYDASPFATKVKHMLTLKRIPHKRVEVPMTMPRPELSEYLGINYRKVPVLAIGNDVYCDTGIIASVLERRFPVADGYGTLFPSRVGSDKADTGMTVALMMYWSDRTVFPLAAGSLPYAKFSESFLKDRAEWIGKPINVKGMEAAQPETTSALASHLTLLEQQLGDGREWLMDTTDPSLADISAHFVFNWVKFFRNVREIFDVNVFPKSIIWLARMNEYLDKLQKSAAAPFEALSGADAATTICASVAQSPLRSEITDLSRLLLKLGDSVSVCPSDNGKRPTLGRLLALNGEEVVIETNGKAGTVRCHFPRLNFSVRAVSQIGAKL